ncbi:GNAT family N-acetyltransferase [Rhizobium hidalgonense]|uniref:GNAT family N-acetyltransferase n=1 Tax=Rhizobium hidalgonense TaxID=1538159 RepID=UPI002871D8B1|nr:GNAT family N-acetyltransferase [Rhizobium hidalgonense]MDR9814828.1 GNAT family N-acetyltransferase [Rhizobium hidalgonense]
MFDRQPVLYNERVIIRPLNREDFGALYAVASDPLLWELHPASNRWKKDVFKQLFNAALDSGGALTVIDKGANQIIGSSRFNVPDLKSSRAEIGWSYLARDYWGGAWNREIKRMLMSHAFRFVDTVYFRIGDENMRSRRATEKLGTRLSEETEIIKMPDGAPVRHVIYEITKQEFADQPLLPS